MSKSDKREPRHLHVTGDVVVYHNIYRGHREHPTEKGDGTRIIRWPDGAGLTARLLHDLCADEPMFTVHDATTKADHHAYAAWSPVPGKRYGGKKDPQVWRVTESLGFGTPEADALAVEKVAAAADDAPCDILVIDESGLGFRNRPDTWPDALVGETDSAPWIVLRMSHQVSRGALWTHLARDFFLERLIVIVSADDLRRSGASISCDVSWEESVRGLLDDLAYHAELREICRARHVIVNFGHDGALWVDHSDRAAPRRRLVFDPGHIEGSWREGLQGTVPRVEACLSASIAYTLLTTSQPEEADLSIGIGRGLAAGRALLEAGHGAADSEKPGFPTETAIEALRDPRGGKLRTVSVPEFAVPGPPGARVAEGHDWSIIAGNHLEDYRPLMARAREVALHGDAALSGVPNGKFGKLYTVDRYELSGYYGVRRLMTDYVGEKNPDKPLCLGVFGPPGSGKSFGIKQIARGILGPDAPILTFNLSQFSGPEMLVGALHQVRDEVLKGHVPVVFWDEFDSEKLRWLQYMLAPMNDGEFLEGQVTHPIGKSIFIFAGGTSDSLENFCRREADTEQKAFVDAKGPDFISRLKGYLNVLGPNPRRVAGEVDPMDVGYPIRRAIMLRVQAKRFGSAPLSIDAGLLNAMLKIGEFKHGARSMATIVNLTTGDGKRELLRCNLPPREQLGLHVDYDEFMALVQEGTMFRLKAEQLAPHIHEFYLDLAKKEGWTPRYPMPYEELPEEIKQDNIAAARRIPEVLALVGLGVVAAEPGAPADPAVAAKIIEKNIERLAEGEHDGWMETKFANGWERAEARDDAKRQHNALVSYVDLHEEDKQKDRNAVRHYPDIVKRAGFEIRPESDSN